MAVSMSVSLRHVSTSGRTATVGMVVTVTTTGSSYNETGPSGSFQLTAGNGTITSPGTTGTFSHNIPANSTTVVYQTNIKIDYNLLGKASLTAKVTFATGISAGTLTKTASITLPDIDKKNEGELTVTGLSSGGDNLLGETYTVNLNLPNVTGTSSIGYSVYVRSFGTLPNKGRTVGSGSAKPGSIVTMEWTPAVEQFEPYLDGATHDTCVLVAELSVNGLAWRTLSTSFDLHLPDGYEPVIGEIDVTDASGLYESTGVVVSGKSSLTMRVAVAPQGVASITSVRMTFAGVYYAMTSTDSGATWQASTGTVYAEPSLLAGYIRATDSRGLSSTKYFGLNTRDMESPSLSDCRAYRYSTSTGEEDDSSTTVRVDIACVMPSLGSTSGGTITVRYCAVGSASWTSVATISVTSSYSGYRNITGLSTDTSYIVEITATSASGASTTIDLTVGTDKPVIDFFEDTGMALWGVASDPGLTVNGRLNLAGSVYVRADATLPWVLAMRLQSFTSTYDTTLDVMMPKINISNDARLAGYASGDVGAYDFLSFNSSGRPVLENHTVLANGMWLQGMLSTGSMTNILRMSSSNQVELGWTEQGLGGDVRKTLWSGSWSSGSITVSGNMKYSVFIVTLGTSTSSQQMKILAVRDVAGDPSRIAGIGGASKGDNTGQYILSCYFEQSSTTRWTYVSANGMIHNANGQHEGVDYNVVVRKIEGLI